MNNDQPLIICENIWKTYGKGASEVHALQGVNLIVNRGELRLLMGPSGSGKTTLISIIAALLTPDKGECLINNIDLNKKSDEEKTHYRGAHIGFVFQAFNLIPMLTAEENVSLPLLINGVPRKEAEERAKQALRDLDMESKIGSFPWQLSGGQQQRIAILRALINNPELIVCDEPTSSLDHVTGAKIMEALRDLVVKYKTTLIVVTHDPRIMQYADKIDHLEDGRIISNS